MSINHRLVVVLASIFAPLASAAALQNTGTVDTLIEQGQVEFQLQQKEILEAAKQRAEPKATTVPVKHATPDPTFEYLTERTGTVEVKKYTDRLNFVGVFVSEKSKQAEIYYKGSTNFYNVGSNLPRGFKLVDVTDSSIKVRSRRTGSTQTLYMRSIASIEQEKRDFYSRKSELDMIDQARIR